MPVPERFDDYLRDPRRSHARKQMNRARRAGYSDGRVDPLEHLGEILDIYRSAEERQGQPTHADCTDESKVRQYFEGSAEVFGVFDAAGQVRAYRGLRTCDTVASGERVLGHADHLDKGIMSLLFVEIIRELADTRAASRRPE
jgi:hypothetical protein